MKKAIKISNAPAPIGPYSPAILAKDTLFVSGQIPIDSKTGKLIESGIEESCKLVMENIGNLLIEAEMDFSNVVKCSIFLKDFNDFAKVNEIYGSYFNENPPARETVQVCRLPLDASIEISCIAIK